MNCRRDSESRSNMPVARTGALIVALTLVVAVALVFLRLDNNGSNSSMHPRTENTGSRSMQFDNGRKTPISVQSLAKQLEPRDLILKPDSSNPDKFVALNKQFYHLHHMKTGGTSINHLINCALSRARKGHLNVSTIPTNNKPNNANQIPYFNVEECNQHSYKKCVSGESETCVNRINTTAVLGFCAPLYQADLFGWEAADSITVIRNPVERVWSMFRFKTKNCYHCLNLTTIYEHIDNGTIGELQLGAREATCVSQLLNHQTTNLLSSPIADFDTDEQKVNDAIFNLRNRFTLIGLTDQIVATAHMIGQVFPWLAERLSAEEYYDKDNNTENDTNAAAAAAPESIDRASNSNTCPLPHSNGSPKNNHCGPQNSHWDLPPLPDEETVKVILAHNQLDLKLYQAAVQRFEMQKRALRWAEEID